MSRKKLGLAMEFMYDSDPTFRAAVEALVPELREGKKVGGVQRERAVLQRTNR